MSNILQKFVFYIFCDTHSTRFVIWTYFRFVIALETYERSKSKNGCKLRNETLCTNITSGFPFLWVQKTKSSFQLVWTTFVHYLLWSKIKSVGTVCGIPTHNIFRTLIKLPNFSFDVQSQLLDLISFRDAHFTVDVWAIVCATNRMHKWNMLARRFPHFTRLTV